MGKKRIVISDSLEVSSLSGRVVNDRFNFLVDGTLSHHVYRKLFPTSDGRLRFMDERTREEFYTTEDLDTVDANWDESKIILAHMESLRAR